MIGLTYWQSIENLLQLALSLSDALHAPLVYTASITHIYMYHTQCLVPEEN